MIDLFSPHLTRALLIGTIAPVFAFVLVLSRVLPDTPFILGSPSAEESQGIVVLATVVFIAAAALRAFNVPLIRLLEGYPWEETLIGRLRKRRYQRAFDRTCSLYHGLRTLNYARPDPRAQQVWNWAAASFNDEFPDRRDLVLPSRLGNVIRSFESYPRRQYQMESIALWPRLMAVVDPDYRTAVAEAKALFDFTLNLTILSALLGTGLVIDALLRTWTDSVVLGLTGGTPVAIGALVATLVFHRLTIGRAVAWGAVVKGAFDLYRWKLLESFGYRYRPESIAAERGLWADISNQLSYGDSPRVPPAQYGSGLRLASEPTGIGIRALRTVHGVDSCTTEVFIHLSNVDRYRRDAESVEVQDVLPADRALIEGSATVDRGVLQVSGNGVYTFRTSPLVAGEDIVIRYRMLCLTGSSEPPRQSGESSTEPQSAEKGEFP
jgi:hypothetical protein